MNENLTELQRTREEINHQLINMATKNYFVMAFIKAVNSKNFAKYLKYKNELLNANGFERQLLINKIIKLESFGSVSDYLYLLGHCESVKMYINLKLELIELDDKINEFNQDIEEKEIDNIIYFDNFLVNSKSKTLIK